MRSITVIMLNFRREANVPRLLDALCEQTIKPSIWLWNNAGRPLKDSRVDREVVADANWYCWPRWFLASYANTEHIMMIDDDIIPKSTRLLEIAVEALEKEHLPETIIGAQGVVLGPGRHYWPRSGAMHFKKVVKDVRVDIVKGRCLALKTKALSNLPLSPPHRDVCDDIVVSGLLARGRERIHVISAALGDALEDIPDLYPEVALCKGPHWREIRDSAGVHYFTVSEKGRQVP